MTRRLPTYFLTHGGGPWPYMEGPFRRNFDELEKSLKHIRLELDDRPDAVLVVSGHWEAPAFTLSSSQRPGMLFDYSGFPDEMYRISYDALGSPSLAEQVHGMLSNANFAVESDANRGFDHGTFSLMKPLYPDAEIPLVQLSLKQGFDPAEHLRMGEILAPLRDENILILGSGASYHDLRTMGAEGARPSAEFDNWLALALSLPEQDRVSALIDWENAPSARQAHPREDHLLPLMVAVGAAAGDSATRVFHQTDFMGAISISSFRFGDAPDYA